MTELELQHVSYRYGAGTPFEKLALDDVSVRFEAGVINGLIGHTGSGKSTLVQLLNGLLKPDSGTILLDRRDLWADPKKMRENRFRVGLVFQYPEYQLFEESVAKDIAYGPTNMKLPPEEISRRVAQSMAFCGLPASLADQSPFALSGGQKRRVAIAGILAMEPQVLVLDEPAAGLDPMGREEILGGIWSYQRKTHITVILISHSMEDMARYSDRLIVMKKGRLAAAGSAREIFSQPELLRDAGLNVPAITSLMHTLRARGLNVPTDVLTVEDAKRVLMPLLKRKEAR